MIAANGISIPNCLLNVTVTRVMWRKMVAVVMCTAAAAGAVIIIVVMMVMGAGAVDRSVSNVQYMRLSF